MRLLIILALLSVSCTRSSQSYTSDEYRRQCQSICKEDYGTDVDWVGSFTGKCYCK